MSKRTLHSQAKHKPVLRKYSRVVSFKTAKPISLQCILVVRIDVDAVRVKAVRIAETQIETQIEKLKE